MFKQLSKGLKKFIYHHTILLFLLLIYPAALSYCSYMGGLTVTESKEYFGVRFLLILLFLPFLLLIFIYYIIILFKVEKKYVLPSIALAVIFLIAFLYTFGWGMVGCPAKGYYDYVKKNVNMDEIHQWLINYEQHSEYEFVNDDGIKQDRVFDYDWPEEIKALNPSRGVLIFDNEEKNI